MTGAITNRFTPIFAATNRSRGYNFHSHTQFCDGKATMAEFAAEAAARGFDAYGFSPHSPIPFSSPCNMTFESVETYLAEFRRLRELHEGQIKLYCAMEIDYIGDGWGPANDYFASLGLDYAIGSVHFIPSPRDGMIDVDGRFSSFRIKVNRYFDGDIRGVVERFYEQSLKMVEAGGFDILGHLDKIGHNASLYSPGIADEDWYRTYVYELARRVADRGLAIEINTKAWRSAARLFPDVRFIHHIASLGVDMPVDSDAHLPSLIDTGRAEAEALLQLP